MKRYAALAVAAVLALLGITALAPGAQARPMTYPVPNLHLVLSTQKVVSGHTFKATVTSNIVCTPLTAAWNGQTASANGSKVVHTFKAPIVTKTKVIPMVATCRYTTIVGASGHALKATSHVLRTTANVTVTPVKRVIVPGVPDTGASLPNTGGPNLAWFIAGAAAVLAGGGAMIVGRRRRSDKVAH